MVPIIRFIRNAIFLACVLMIWPTVAAFHTSSVSLPIGSNGLQLVYKVQWTLFGMSQTFSTTKGWWTIASEATDVWKRATNAYGDIYRPKSGGDYYIAYHHGVFKLSPATGVLSPSCLGKDPLDHVGRFSLGYGLNDLQKRGRGDYVEYQVKGEPAPLKVLGWCGFP
jgi:hypothetical protein